MRLHLRSRAGDASDGVRRTRGGIDRKSPPGVLTAWLRQGVRAGICPLCRVAHKADREYIWHFCDEGADQEESIDKVRQACGFCRDRIAMLCHIETKGMKSTLAISTMFADTFAGMVRDLQSLAPGAAFLRDPCPACANRDQRLTANTQYLLAELATNPGFREKFEASPGLCFAHFELVWSLAETTEERELVGRVQLNAATGLLRDLTEHVRKQDQKYRHEPKGAEGDAWRRAIFMTAGWPPPGESAAEPEAR